MSLFVKSSGNRKVKDIHLFDRCIMSYFGTFDPKNNHKESIVNKNCQNSTSAHKIYLFCFFRSGHHLVK